MVIITITSMMSITCSFLFLDSSIFCNFVYFLFAHLKKKKALMIICMPTNQLFKPPKPLQKILIVKKSQ